MVQSILRRTHTNQQTRLLLALSPENWVRDGAKAVDKDNNIVGTPSILAVRFSVLGLITRKYGMSNFIKGIYYRALLVNNLPLHNIDCKITLEQANQVLSTFETLRKQS